MSDERPSPVLSVVVPVWHDTSALAGLLEMARPDTDEWIVVNGDVEDRSLDPVRRRHPDVVWLDSPAGRGRQLAMGAARARGDVVVLLHADTCLGQGWRADVTAVGPGASLHWGCFRLRLDASAWQARVIEWVVRLRVWLFRLPYGDQAIFVRRATLEAVGGIQAVPLMEDVALARALSQLGPPLRSPIEAVTSARRWQRDGWVRRTMRNWWTMGQYLCGVPPERLVRTYAGGAREAPGTDHGTDRC